MNVPRAFTISGVQLTDSYALSPGQCTICGGQNLPAINTLRDIDRGADRIERMYICSNCGAEIGEMFGLVPETKVKRDRAALRRVTKKLERAETDLASIADRVTEALKDPTPDPADEED